MSKISRAIGICLIAGLWVVSTTAFAKNPLGFYVGLGVGESTVRSDNYFGFDGYDHNHHFAWKALAGVRPLPIVAAEIEYMDFGHPGSDGTYYDSSYSSGPDSHPRALAAFGVGYLPLPLPFLDIYAKAGVARLHTLVNGFDGSACPIDQPCPRYTIRVAENRWDTRFAYGAGVQSKFWGLSVRAEYERINSPHGDPDMFSVGATWSF